MKPGMERKYLSIPYGPCMTLICHLSANLSASGVISNLWAKNFMLIIELTAGRVWLDCPHNLILYNCLTGLLLLSCPGMRASLKKNIQYELETNRLRLRRLVLEDAPFILALLNEPSFLQNIGDKNVRTLEEAQDYLVTGPIRSYVRYGFGLYAVVQKETHAVMGICGLIKREEMDDIDIGFAFLPWFWGKGYAVESASAIMIKAREELGLNQIVAVTIPDNHRSIRVLEKIGLRFEKMIRLSEEGEALRLYA